MTVYWTPEMSVGNLILDADHRYLFALINTVELALRCERPEDELRRALDHLVGYTREHFAREEKLQIKVRFAQYAQHRAEHERILAKLEDLRERLFPGRRGSGEGTGDGAGTLPPGEIHELGALLREWVLEHVLTSDRKMQPLLARYPKNFL